MTALLLSLGASLAWGVSDFGGGTAARRYNAVTVLLLMRIGGGLAMGTVALATTPAWIGDRWPMVVAAVLLTSVGGVTLLRALAIGPMGVTAPIIAASGTVPAVFGLATDAAPGGAVLAGLAVAASGAVLASRAPGHTGERAKRTGIAYAVVTAVLIGSGMLMVHEAAAASPVTAVLLVRVGEICLLSLALAVGPLTLSRTTPRGVLPLLGFGAIESTAITLYATASTLGSLTLAAVLSSLYPVITVLLARIVHHERLSHGQLAGALLTFGGIVIVVAVGA